MRDAYSGGGIGWCVTASSCAPNKQDYTSCSSKYVAWVYTTAGDQVTPYSNVASFLDLFAPSHNAYTTALGGTYTNRFGGTSAAFHGYSPPCTVEPWSQESHRRVTPP